MQKDTGSSTRAAPKCLLELGVCMEALWPYGSSSSDPDSGLFINVDSPPNRCAPTDLSKATLQARGLSLASTAPEATRGVLQPQQQQDPQRSLNMPIKFSRIFDIAANARIQNHVDMTDSDWQMIYNQPAVAPLEQCPRGGFPFVFSTQLLLGARLNKNELDQDSVFVKPPTQNVVKRGRHTILAVNFDPGRRLFLVQNSAGSKWPQNYAGADERLCGCFWMPYEWFEATVNGQPITYDFWVLKLN